jgi:hypothetical protein
MLGGRSPEYYQMRSVHQAPQGEDVSLQNIGNLNKHRYSQL